MAEHCFITEGGYFYKMAPPIALPMQTDLFGQPLGNSNHTVEQLHGYFMNKYKEKGRNHILLKITGRCTIYDDVLAEGEERQLESWLNIQCSDKIFAYPYQIGHRYLISTENIREI